MDLEMIFAWPCGHEVQPEDVCRCMVCYADGLYGKDESHETQRLFAPPAAQLPGQTFFE